MALNWTMLNPNRSPVPLPNEMNITTVDSGVDLTLTIPDVAPTGTAPAGGSGGSKRLKSLGRLWLTDQRLIFTSDAGPGTPLDSLSVPLPAILATRFEQPTFAANFLAFDVRPAPAGGLTEGTRAELRFRDRAMFEFVSLLEKTRERAIYMKRQAVEEDADNLRLIGSGAATYTSPAETSSTSVSLAMGANIPIDNPPGYNS
ncbi:hypothetical protein H0H81_001927 [Sphagnurus paluster]|uniref:Uncharacterized protein n=1 Tax=Sphagnurus paluster TaxID=117069 RepID=A0A9P7FZP5_9AGAR|nr:hypothetical protein H0H81_001927 [Sphagnurus paluster]